MDILFGGGCDGGNAVSKLFEGIAPGIARSLPTLREPQRVAAGPNQWADEFSRAQRQPELAQTGAVPPTAHAASVAMAAGKVELSTAWASAQKGAQWAGEFAASAPAQTWAGEFADANVPTDADGVPVFAAEGEAAATFEQREAASKFHGFMRAVEGGTVTVADDGVYDASGIPVVAADVGAGQTAATATSAAAAAALAATATAGLPNAPILRGDADALAAAWGNAAAGNAVGASAAVVENLRQQRAETAAVQQVVVANPLATATSSPPAASTARGSRERTSIPSGTESSLGWDGLLSDAWADGGLQAAWQGAVATARAQQPAGAAAAADGESATAARSAWGDEFEVEGILAALRQQMGDGAADALAEATAAPSAAGRDWATELAATTAEEYHFAIFNPYVSSGDPVSDGVEAADRGDVADAILAYEAAVARDPTDAAVWVTLGLAQAENERDDLAIAAFQRAVEEDPTYRGSYFGAAVSHANEGNIAVAVESLTTWVRTHPLAHTSTVALDTEAPGAPWWEVSTMRQEALRSRLSAYLAHTEQCDPSRRDLLMALGILHHLNREHGDAADAFRAALRGDPRSAQLWNKLGATLTNAGKHEDAERALRRALDLKPGYVRALCNLGVMESNRGNTEASLRHWLNALVLQRRTASAMAAQGRDSPWGARALSGLWQNVRTAVAMMGRGDLFAHAINQSLDGFAAEFDLPL